MKAERFLSFERFLLNQVGKLCRSVAGRLDSTWKNFAGGLDERTTVLALSVLFHQKAENVRLENLAFASNLLFSILRMSTLGLPVVKFSKSRVTSQFLNSPFIITSPSMRGCARLTLR